MSKAKGGNPPKQSEDLQSQLKSVYCPPLDPSLVAATANDEGKTLRSVKEVFNALAGELDDSNRGSEPKADASADDSGEDEAVHVQRLLEEVDLAKKLDSERETSDNEDAASKRHPLYSHGETGGDSPETGSIGEDAPFFTYDAGQHGDLSLLHELTQRQSKGGQAKGGTATDDAAYFLLYAFPTRTKDFLQEMLDSCNGNLAMTVDTLMAIDYVERQEADESARASLPSQQAYLSSSSSSTHPPQQKGLDYESLAAGDGRVKGKKSRAMRKRAQEEQTRAVGGNTGPVKNFDTKVTLGDVRQGGSIPRTRKTGSRQISSRGPALVDEAMHLSQAGRSDFEIARHLAKAEDLEAGEPIEDNHWLLSSSILAQLTDLLELEAKQVSSIYHRSGFNLKIAVGRLVDANADQYPSLASLDEAGPSPVGTAEAIVNSLASLAGKGVAFTSLCLRATKGRQDAALDLLNLMDVVRDAAGAEKQDGLHPLGKLRHPDAAEPKSAVSTRRSVNVNSNSHLDPRLCEKVDFEAIEHAKQSGALSGAAVAGRNNGLMTASGQAKAMASLREGSTPTISFPRSAAQMDLESIASAARLTFAGGGGAPMRANGVRTIRDRETAITRAQELASEYQARRNRCLVQASTAWRSSPANRGAAFYYADEARRLDAKLRSWSLRVAEELVAYRRAGNDGSGAGCLPGVIDLHGVTTREALIIVGEELNIWWSKPGRRDPLTIITGAGRHSPNQVAMAKYLQREQWRANVDRTRGVIVVRGR